MRRDPASADPMNPTDTKGDPMPTNPKDIDPAELLRTAHGLYARSDRGTSSTRAPIAALLGIGFALLAARPDDEIETLLAEREAARAELARIDHKAGIILSGAGVLLSAAVAVAALGRPSALAGGTAGLWAALTVLACSCAVLLWVIRPVLPTSGATGFLAYAEASDPAELRVALGDDARDRLAADVHKLSTLARRKYRGLRAGIDLLLVALVVLAGVVPFI